jgi:hypothetical protein
MLRMILLVVALIVATVAQVQAHAHQGKDGQTMHYPRECCGKEDCSPVSRTQRVGAGIWLYLADGTHHLITAGEKRRLSGDGDWHICTRFDHEAQTKVVTCVFEPAIN